MKIERLESLERLPEVYRLRVKAYSDSPCSSLVTPDRYPNGLSDHLEEMSVHFAAVDSGMIVGSARLTKLHSVKNLPYSKIFSKVVLPTERPFWFFSKLVVCPAARGHNLGERMDRCRFDFLKQTESKTFALMTAKKWRARKLALVGWEALGAVDSSLDPAYPYHSSEDTFILVCRLPYDI